MKQARSGFRLVLALLALAAAGRAGAAEVAVLKSSEVAAWRPTVDALRRAAGSHNLTEYDLRGDRVEGERVLGGLKGKSVILVAMGPLAAQLAHDLLPEAPLVFTMVQDPAKLGLAGSNITGVSFSIPVRNQLAAFRLVNPKGVRIGVIYNEDNTGRLVQEAQKAAGLVRLLLVAKPIASDKEIPQALRALLSGENAVDALWMPPDPIIMAEESRRFLFAETVKAGKPVYGFSAALVNEGALVSNGPSLASIGEQAGDLVNRIASGEKGRIEQVVPQAELVINTKVAGRLKLEIPPNALIAANKKL
jgi:putative ABC transport system substrate-binding protein